MLSSDDVELLVFVLLIVIAGDVASLVKIVLVEWMLVSIVRVIIVRHLQVFLSTYVDFIIC